MKILGIDTSTVFLSLGICDGPGVSEYNVELGRKHSALLVPSIARVLAALGWKAQDIDYFACGLGPGSFTGMRIGLAAVKGLAYALKKPVVGISTLDILAENVRFSDSRALPFVIPALDARRDLIYCSIYKNKNGSLERIAPYSLVTLSEFHKKTRDGSVILGDALNLYKEQILKKAKGVRVLEKDYWYPKGRNIISLARQRIKERKIENAFTVKPVYLYPKECQIRKECR
ncbi:MAG: tRNA (adenosine(37)-N6)-threonylcarbamoyltransferase complex dimerization subunit type 1 TsaB [Deltaproteobacteria bacterium]